MRRRKKRLFNQAGEICQLRDVTFIKSNDDNFQRRECEVDFKDLCRLRKKKLLSRFFLLANRKKSIFSLPTFFESRDPKISSFSGGRKTRGVNQRSVHFRLLLTRLANTKFAIVSISTDVRYEDLEFQCH